MNLKFWKKNSQAVPVKKETKKPTASDIKNELEEELEEELNEASVSPEVEQYATENEEIDEDDIPEGWIHEDYEEGQLSIDVYQTPKNIVVKSTIAGVKPDDIDISINNDMLTIRGKREECQEKDGKEYLFRECYWGSFSRSIILPVEVSANKIDAILENGVLTVTLPKLKAQKQINVKVKKK